MKTITFLNEKGGVGKTTLAMTLACALARDGAMVMILDTDPQATLTYALGLQKAPHFYNLIQRQEAWGTLAKRVDTERIAPAAKGQLWVLPGDRESRNLTVENAMLLHHRLQELTKSFDYVIVDTAPSASLLHILVYIATDYIIYPTQLEHFSMEGLRESLNVMGAYTGVRQGLGRPAIQMLGIIPTMTRLNTQEHSLNMADLQAAGMTVFRPMHNRIVWPASTSTRQSIFAYDSNTEAARDAETFFSQVKAALAATTA